MEENDILVEDKLETTYEGNNSFHVIVFGDGVEVPKANDNDIIVSLMIFQVMVLAPSLMGVQLIVLALMRLRSTRSSAQRSHNPTLMWVDWNERYQIRLCNIREGISSMIWG